MDGEKRSVFERDPAPDRFRAETSELDFSGDSAMLFEQAMSQTSMPMVLVDPHQDDQPIVFANRAFLDLTGYSEDEVLGRNCRFLQGDQTDPETVARIRRAVAATENIVVELLNFRKSGERFWNALHIGPIHDESGRVRYIFGSQLDVTHVHAARAEQQHALQMERELSHRMKNMFSVITSIVRMVGRAHDAPEITEAVTSRVRALGRASEATLDLSFDEGVLDPGPLFSRLLVPFTGDPGRIGLSGPAVMMTSSSVNILALLLTELAERADDAGVFADAQGRIDLTWTASRTDEGGDRLDLTWTASAAGTPGDTEDSDGIAEQILRAAGGTIRTDGARTEIALPL